VTDKKDDYYQPWLRDPVPASAPADDDARPAPAPTAPEEGLAKPPAAPPIGLDVSRYPAEERVPARPIVDSERLKAGASSAWRAIRDGSSAFADWTIRVGDKADVPAHVEAMEIPRRSRELAGKTADATARAAKALGRGTVRGGAAAGAASARAWEKMALGKKVGKLSSDAQRGLGDVAGKVAGKAGEALGQAAKAGKESLGEAATKLRPAPRTEAEPPASGLEQLLAREAQEEAAAVAVTKAAAPDLPLFASEPGIELAAPKPAPAKTTKAAAATPPPSVSAPAPDDRQPHRPAAPPRASSGGVSGSGGFALPAPMWMVALGALLLLGTSFWLGGRFGGGLSKSEVETIVADYIAENPEMIPAAFDAQRGREMAKAIGAIRPALEKPYAGAWAGNADGDVTLTVFTDYACGYCRASLPDLDRLIRSDRRVKVVFRELPIISAQSRAAAIMALAAARQGKYDAFHHAMFASPSLDAAGIAAAAEKAGVVTDGTADATANEALLQREIDSNLAIASQLQLNATPTWVIGDQLLQGQIGYDGLRVAVAKARAKG
jgi:predicted DsbA family dithiol-disulfide isomerase